MSARITEAMVEAGARALVKRNEEQYRIHSTPAGIAVSLNADVLWRNYEHEVRAALAAALSAEPGEAEDRALLDELSRLRTALVDIRIELIHGEGDTYERITTCKEIVERALSEREGQDG